MVCLSCEWRSYDELNFTQPAIRTICIYGMDRWMYIMYDFHCGNASVEYYSTLFSF